MKTHPVVRDAAFAKSASYQSPVTVKLTDIPWPQGLAPEVAKLGSYKTGEKITGAVSAPCDVLVILFTEEETCAFLEVFTGDNSWTPERQKEWCEYAHNFSEIKPLISGIDGDRALEDGAFGYLSAVTVGGKNVVLYKTELHPKQNGSKMPFVPVIQQLVSELSPSLVISTGTAGGVGSALLCGDVVVLNTARFKCLTKYASFPEINALSDAATAIGSGYEPNLKYLQYAAENLTPLALPGLLKCWTELQKSSGYGYVKKNVKAPAIYVTTQNPVPGPEPMATVSADYFTNDDSEDTEWLQALGVVN